jgi:hypothetical protein
MFAHEINLSLAQLPLLQIAEPETVFVHFDSFVVEVCKEFKKHHTHLITFYFLDGTITSTYHKKVVAFFPIKHNFNFHARYFITEKQIYYKHLVVESNF